MRVALSVCLILSGPATAALAAEPLTMKDAEARAECANPRLTASRLEAVAAEHREEQAHSRHWGQIDAVGSYNNYESPRLVRPISIEQFQVPALGLYQLPWDQNQTHYGFAFQLPLLAGGALHEGDRSASLARSAAEKTASFTRDEVRTNVRAAYRSALLARHALAAARQYAAALTKDEADARLKVRLGSAAPVDAAKVTYALRGAEAQVAELETQERTTQAYLAALMERTRPPGDGTSRTSPRSRRERASRRTTSRTPSRCVPTSRPCATRRTSPRAGSGSRARPSARESRSRATSSGIARLP